MKLQKILFGFLSIATLMTISPVTAFAHTAEMQATTSQTEEEESKTGSFFLRAGKEYISFDGFNFYVSAGAKGHHIQPIVGTGTMTVHAHTWKLTPGYGIYCMYCGYDVD